MFVPILAGILIHEQLSFLGVIGITLVIVGIYVIHLRSFSIQSFLEPIRSMRGSASLWAPCTGGTIAGYSLANRIARLIWGMKSFSFV